MNNNQQHNQKQADQAEPEPEPTAKPHRSRSGHRHRHQRNAVERMRDALAQIVYGKTHVSKHAGGRKHKLSWRERRNKRNKAARAARRITRHRSGERKQPRGKR